MIPKECKRLAEVDFPIAVVSKHAAREKSIRHGHPSTLHLWWARRPLAACRAMLLGLLLPDPCDEYCPTEFKKKAREMLPSVVGQIGKKDKDLRQAILRFIGDFANWDLSADRTYLEVSRGLVKAAHGEEAPLVVDPFAGGGSIPLEALRLGCEAFASDLNPVACLILKVMLEDIPRHGSELAEELQRVGAEIKATVEKELAEFYPVDKDGSRPIAYIWARTVRCEQQDYGCEIPLLRTNWLAKRYNKKTKQYTKLVLLSLVCDKEKKTTCSSITVHKTPTTTLPSIPAPTIIGGKGICPLCKRPLSDTSVRAQLRDQRGGTDTVVNEKGSYIAGAKLLAVVLRTEEEPGLIYRIPTRQDLLAVLRAHQSYESNPKSKFPSEPINPARPSPNARGVSGATRIGITDFGRLFTTRQKLVLQKLIELENRLSLDCSLQRLCALAVSKQAERCSSFVTWINSTEAPRGTFSRQALTIAWDFIELVPIAGQEEFIELIDAMANVLKATALSNLRAGQVDQAKAKSCPLPDKSVGIWFTDPPYYDAVPYADLSDLFYVWLKRLISNSNFDKYSNDSPEGLSPKADECSWNRAHVVMGIEKSPKFFENCVTRGFVEGRRVLEEEGIACVVFAHKTTEGWEALLSGLLVAGWTVVGSWPVTTERNARLNAKEAAALATSVHIVCRPRQKNALIGDWGDVLRELPKRIGDWMERLSAEGVRGADLVFACIGPAMEVYSRYSKVEDDEGREIPLGGDPTAAEPYKRGFLAYVWETVGRTALGQILGTAEAKARNGGAGALEEDARLTALFLWTLQSTDGEVNATKADADEEDPSDDDEDEENQSTPKKKGFTLIYDVARRFAQPLGIHLDQWEGRIIETRKGIVRLLPVAERAEQLFGEEGASAVADRIEANPTGPIQMGLFTGEAPEIRSGGRKKTKKPSSTKVTDEKLAENREATTLDRVHAAMLLQAGGRSNALRALLKAEQERSPDFLRLANHLSPLYPKDGDEKRLLDAMLLAVPR